MSVPTNFDFAVFKIGDGTTPSEVFTIVCGVTDVTINQVANSSDRFIRDCAKPGQVPSRKVRVTGKQLDITATGLTDLTTFDTYSDVIGTRKNVKVELYADDGTDTGDLLGTIAANMLIASLNVGVPRDGESSAEFALASHGDWTFTAA
jgi:hypothetical protein